MAATIGVLFVASFVFFLSFITPAKPEAVRAGNLADFVVNEPVYFKDGDFWLVRTGEAEAVALAPIDPHGRATCTGTEASLGQQYRSDFTQTTVVWEASMNFADAQGFFWAICSGSRFTRTGERIYGPTPRGLDYYPVTIKDGFVTVSANKHDIIRRPRVDGGR